VGPVDRKSFGAAEVRPEAVHEADFGVFLAGRPGNFFALKKDVMLARPSAAAAASVFGIF
jgi:hypothetical protein